MLKLGGGEKQLISVRLRFNGKPIGISKEISRTRAIRTRVVESICRTSKANLSEVFDGKDTTTCPVCRWENILHEFRNLLPSAYFKCCLSYRAVRFMALHIKSIPAL